MFKTILTIITKSVVPVVLSASASVALSGTANASNTRTWVSGTGADQAGCGAVANPCRTLQFAHDQTIAGGEINFKDSAGYGSLVITKAISIVADGVMAGVLAPARGNALEINAGTSDAVVLRGLTVEGANAGYNGIVFNSGKRLDISNCVAQNFKSSGNGDAGNGIFLRPTAGYPVISIVGTTTSNNELVGVLYNPSPGSSADSTLTIDRVTSIGNLYGVFVSGTNSSRYTRLVVTNAISSNNGFMGFYIEKATASIDLTTAGQNGNEGVLAKTGASVTVGRSLLVGNGRPGIANDGGSVSSYRDNRLENNGGGPTSGTITTATTN